MKQVWALGAVGFALMLSAPIYAQDLTQTANDVVSMMAGTYESGPQVDGEASRGVPADQRHIKRHVLYARIDAPQIGRFVLYRQERKDNAEGEIVARGLAVFEPDPDAGGIRMWLRNIVNADQFTDLHQKPQLWSNVAFDPAYGGKCPFHWRRENNAIVGTLLGGGCRIVSNAGKPMSFDARWTLSAQELTIFDNTYDGDGNLLGGRADKVPTVYTRVRRDRP